MPLRTNVSITRLLVVKSSSRLGEHFFRRARRYQIIISLLIPRLFSSLM
jgi:hypothetical protein